jgi:hypothetical protein
MAKVKVPLLSELLEHPWVSSILCTMGWMLPPSSRTDQGPRSCVNPAKGNAFPKAGMLSTLRKPDEVKIALHSTWTGSLHYAAALLG